MSQDRAISKPPPRAEPSMAAMVGIGRLPETEQNHELIYSLRLL